MEMIRMALTGWEKNFLLHRLSVPDCIGDAVGTMLTEELTESNDSFDQIYPVIMDALTNIADRMETEVRKHGVIEFNKGDRLEVEVVRDAIDGSTWFANCEDWSRSKFSSHLQQLETLIERLKAEGIKVDKPFI